MSLLHALEENSIDKTHNHQSVTCLLLAGARTNAFQKSDSWVPSMWVKSNAWRREKKELKYVVTKASYLCEHHHGLLTETAWIKILNR